MIGYSAIIPLNEPKAELIRAAARAARAFHSHGIPLTWAVTPQVCQLMADRLNRWRDRFGDDLIMLFDLKPHLSPELDRADPRAVAEESVRLRETLPKLLEEGREGIKRVAPWAEVRVLGADPKRPELLYAMRETGFSGLWGYDPSTDPDSKAPLGFFLISDDSPWSPHPPGDPPLVGAPRSCFKLNDLFRPSPPLDPLSKALWAIDRYLESSNWNETLCFVHEIDPEEYGEIASEYGEDLEAFLDGLSERGLRFTTLTGEIDDFLRRFETTPPFALSVRDDDEGIRFLVYFDDSCKLTFRFDEPAPIDYVNYRTRLGRATGELIHETPRLKKFVTGREGEKLIVLAEVESRSASPYGLALWGDFRGFRLIDTGGSRAMRIGREMMLFRLELEPGINRFRAVLAV